jgi:hypothetical protein
MFFCCCFFGSFCFDFVVFYQCDRHSSPLSFQAKELVESAPCVILKGVKKEEAEEFVEKLKAVGGDVVLE